MALSLSPIQFKESKLLYLSFDDTRLEGSSVLYSDEAAPTSGERFYTLSVDRKLEYTESEDTLTCMGSLRFSWEIKGSDEDDSPIIATVEGAMGACSTCPARMGDPDTIRKTLAANTLSYIWSKLRVIVEQLSSQACIGSLSLPAIDPVALAED